MSTTNPDDIELLYKLIGKRVAGYREITGKSQQELADEAGVTRSAIANLETGRQRIYIHHLTSIAKAFSVSESQFMKGLWV